MRELADDCRAAGLGDVYSSVASRSYRPVVVTARDEYNEYDPMDVRLGRLVRKRIVMRNRDVLVTGRSYGYGFGGSITAGCARVMKIVRSSVDGFLVTWDVHRYYFSVRPDVTIRAMRELRLVIEDDEWAVIHAWLAECAPGLPRGSPMSFFLAEVVLLSVENGLEFDDVSVVRFGDGSIACSTSFVRIDSYAAAVKSRLADHGLRLSTEKTQDSTPVSDALKVGVACGGYIITPRTIRLGPVAVRQIVRATHHSRGALDPRWVTKRWPLLTDLRQLRWIDTVCANRYGAPQQLAQFYRGHVALRSRGGRLGRGF